MCFIWQPLQSINDNKYKCGLLVNISLILVFLICTTGKTTYFAMVITVCAKNMCYVLLFAFMFSFFAFDIIHINLYSVTVALIMYYSSEFELRKIEMSVFLFLATQIK